MRGAWIKTLKNRHQQLGHPKPSHEKLGTFKKMPKGKPQSGPFHHQKFQVPKMKESWTLYISRIHTAYIGEDSSRLGTVELFGAFKNDSVAIR